MRRVIAVGIVLVLVLVTAGCTGTTAQDGQATQTTPTAEAPSGLDQIVSSSSINARLDRIVEEHKEELAEKWTYLNSHDPLEWNGELEPLVRKENGRMVVYADTLDGIGDRLYLGPVIIIVETELGTEEFNLFGGTGSSGSAVAEAHPQGQTIKNVTLYYYKGDTPPDNIMKIMTGEVK